MGSVGFKTFTLAFGLRLRLTGAGGVEGVVSAGTVSGSVPSALARPPSARLDGKMSPDDSIMSRFVAHGMVLDRLGNGWATEDGTVHLLRSIWISIPEDRPVVTPLVCAVLQPECNAIQLVHMHIPIQGFPVSSCIGRRDLPVERCGC